MIKLRYNQIQHLTIKTFNLYNFKTMRHEHTATPEELAEINKTRRISDRRLEDGGAEITADNTLVATYEQIADAKNEMNKELKVRGTESMKEVTGSGTKFSESFYGRHKNLKEKYSGTEFEKMCLIEDLQSAFKNFRFEVKENNDGPDVVLTVDTLYLGKFKATITNEAEIILGPIHSDSSRLIKEVRRVFDHIKEKLGIFIEPRLMLTYGDTKPYRPDPEGLPPTAKAISEEEWASIINKVKESENIHSNGPRIGAKNLRTKYGVINGALVFCDGDVAVFDTPQGKMSVPFADLLDPFGYDYGGKKEKEENERGSQGSAQSKHLEMPLPKQ